MSETWRLKRTKQCAKCPWLTSTDPHDIPNGYCEVKHAALSCTIAEPGSMRDTGRAMACHEAHQAHCIGWLVHQIGVGNNIGNNYFDSSSQRCQARGLGDHGSPRRLPTQVEGGRLCPAGGGR